jgi:alpha-L-fucosidase
MKKLLFIFFLSLISINSLFPQIVVEEENPDRLQWFADAKLGVFIHWGIYSVNGIDESWSFYNEYLSYEDYMKQLDGFTAENYNPKEWAKLIEQSGAKYAVLTSKHHDGVALWDSEFGDLNVVDKSPAGKDLIKPFVKELRKKDIKVGLYYSLLDWSHPDYPNLTRNKKRYEDDSLRWQKFVDFNFGQIGEVSQNYQPDLIWFDGDWEQSAEAWKAKEIRELLLISNPNVIINSRLQGYGDYSTPEQGVPIQKPESQNWELCMTMNDSWGYQHNDSNYKTPNQIIRIFVDCISQGGNLLLDIGPKADGTIPEEQVEILEELGRWTNKHEEAIYGTHAGIPKDYFYGSSTLSNDSTVLFLFLEYKPIGPIAIKGLKNDINRIRVVGNGTKLSHDIKMKQYWSTKPGMLYIDVPEEVLDEQVTVIAIQLDGKVDLFREE